jgi:rhodanese-related sulfurtransferase
MGRVTAPVGGLQTGFWAIGMDYPTETKANEATKTYKFPVVDNIDSDDPWEIIRAAAAKYGQKEEPLTAAELAEGGSEQKHRDWDTDIIPIDLFNLLHDTDSTNDPFVLSVQPKELYAKGHIPGAVWMPITDVCKTENLAKLPTDRRIAVVSNDGQSGSQVSGILNMLGYDAINLLFGMTAWTYDEEIAPGRFQAYEPGKFAVAFKDILSYEICFIQTLASEMLPTIEGWKPQELAPLEEASKEQLAGIY